MDTSVILSALSAIVSLAALANFYSGRRAAIMAQGAKDEKMTRMREEMNQLFSKMRAIEACFHLNDKEMEGMKRDISYIKATVDEIKQAVKSLAK